MTALPLLDWGPFRSDIPLSSIRHHPIWDELRQFLSVEKPGQTSGRRGHTRLELRGLPEELARRALAVTVQCADCGAPIRPVRTRRAPGNKRSESVGKGLFLAVTCELAVSIGCSRGRAARDEYQLIQMEVADV